MGCLQRTCLNKTYSLRRQLVSSYSSAAVLTIMAVMVMAIVIALYAGEVVKDEARDMIYSQVVQSIQDSSRHTSDAYSAKFDTFKGHAALLTEIIRDRIAGYPTYPGWENGTYVPFFDTETQQNAYPLHSSNLLPPSWNITLNLQSESCDRRCFQEHLQERYLYGMLARDRASTSEIGFHFQGQCDPSEADPAGVSYYPNCTDANNNMTTGGVVAPTATTLGLARASADIAPLLKPIYEADPAMTTVSIDFHNSGAGASISFPSTRMFNGLTYQSIGCDWMRETNPYTGQPLATEEEISRCRPNGTIVNTPVRNGMELEVCRDQALHPGQARLFGPYLSDTPGLWFLTAGQAVFDRRTKEFIGCTRINLFLTAVEEQLANFIESDNTDAVLIKHDGTVVTGPGWNSYDPSTTSTMHISETGFVDRATFDKLVSPVNWNEKWEPEDVMLRLAKNIHPFNGATLLAHPVPVPPREYDSNYRPEFYVVFSIGAEVFEVVDVIESEIGKEIRELVFAIVTIGLCGTLVIALTVWLVARLLTRPLKWMEAVSWRIVNHNDQKAAEELQSLRAESSIPKMSCTPNTELHELIFEFHKMIQGFSGTGASRVAHAEVPEVRNEFTWTADLLAVYNLDKATEAPPLIAEEAPAFRSSVQANEVGRFTKLTQKQLSAKSLGESLEESSNVEYESRQGYTSSLRPASSTFLGAGLYLNLGRNVWNSPSSTSSDSGVGIGGKIFRKGRSKLFWWILALIVLPLLITNILICAIVTFDIVEGIPSLVRLTEEESLKLEVDRLNHTARSRAFYAEAALAEPLRNIHMLTRVAGWLIFGGLERSDSFIESETFGIEECKDDVPHESCPFYADKNRATCSCEWADSWGKECHDYEQDTRYLQRNWFVSQRRDADPITGNRNSVPSFPMWGATPATTWWWNETSELPGAYKGNNASGHETAYDRLRVISALSVASLPLYNYITTADNLRFRNLIGTYFAYEADGMFTGYTGCEHGYIKYSNWLSENKKGFLIRPDLCPREKYGYDHRCRGWYAFGKETEFVDGLPLYMTPPYKFTISEGYVGISVGASLIDPSSDEYVGQALIDFVLEDLMEILETQTDAHLYFLISPQTLDGGDTIVGPGHEIGDPPAMIADVILPHDDAASANRREFAKVINSMKSGMDGDASFERTLEDGSVEHLQLSFAPVIGRAARPVDPREFARGADKSELLFWSYGVARLEGTVKGPYNEIKELVDDSLKRMAYIYLIVASVISILCVGFSVAISLEVSSPMSTLLFIVKGVNGGRIEDDIPPLTGGSREVNRVYNSFAKLYKAVRVSNQAFFSGNLNSAYHMMQDALHLFRKINDEKAIAIAHNNIGNVLLANHVNDFKNGPHCTVVDGSCRVASALEHFSRSIEMGTVEFDGGHADDVMTELAQQLADRLFNRGLLYLLSVGDPCCPRNCVELGITDLVRARDLDKRVIEYYMIHRLALKKSDIYFDRILRRIHGLTLLRNVHQDIWQIWDVNELVEEADRLLSAAWTEESAPVFENFTRMGRKQQLEGAVIGMMLASHRDEEASRIGFRMLAEDEFMIESSFVCATDAVLRFLYKAEHDSLVKRRTVAEAKKDLRRMLKACKRPLPDVKKSVVLCFEIGEMLKDDPILRKINRHCMSLYGFCEQSDVIGLVGAASDEAGGRLILELGRKKDEVATQRQFISRASKSTGGATLEPCLPLAIQMMSKSSAPTEGSSYLLFVTDDTSSSLDEESVNTLLKLNEKRTTNKIHVIVVSLEELATEEQTSYQELFCMVSPRSAYFNATKETISSVFAQVNALIFASGGGRQHKSIQSSITMQKF